MTDGICSVPVCDRPTKTRGYCGGHYMRWRKGGDLTTAIADPPLPMPEKFWALVDKRGPDECWPWLGWITPAGYGQFERRTPAHRKAYELTVGPIPDDLTVDHTCHTNDLTCPGGVACLHRRCCNPAHGEPVTRAENVRRGGQRITRCAKGHEFTEANTYRAPKNGRRQCRICRSEKARASDERRRAEWAAGLREPPHGTTYGYLAFKCRCDECKAAMAPYWKRQHRRTNRRLAIR